MFINKINIINLKSCKNTAVDFEKNKPTTLIGKNDSGKSVILNAIGSLLDNKSIKTGTEDLLTSDISNTPIKKNEFDDLIKEMSLPIFEYDEKSAYIIADIVFEDSDLTDDFEKSASPLLKWCIEGAKDKHIYILKKYSLGDDTGKYFISSRDSKEGLLLWDKTQTELNKLLKSHSVTDEDIENDNAKGPFSNLERLRAIYNKLELEQQWVPYVAYTPKKDQLLFPTYRYIDWKTSLKEIESLAKDALEPQIAQHKDALVEQARTISADVNQAVNEALVSKSDSVFENDDNLKRLKVGVSFSVEESVSDLIIQKNNSDGDINLESQGEGVKRQIMFAILKWASINSVEGATSKKFIWCFDEPEVHLYPEAQRNLFEAICELAGSSFQIVLSTHSTIFIDRQEIGNINRLTLKDGYTCVLETDSAEDVHKTLGVQNSDILFFDSFIAVEGPTEFRLFPHMYQLVTGKTLQEDDVKLINLGGKSQWTNNKAILENLLSDFRDTSSVYFILDADTNIDVDNVYLQGTCDWEDSISNELWIDIVSDVCGVDVTAEELQTLREEIDCSQHNKKFHKLLTDLIVSKKPENYLPSKGDELAQILIEKIDTLEKVPSDLRTAITSIVSSDEE
jgi:predicted ATP-dependent endonuclease of OLD family